MLPNQVRQQIVSIATVSGIAGLLLTGLSEGFPQQSSELGTWIVYVAVTALILFVASGLLPFVWFAATRFQPRRAGGGILLWWLLLVALAIYAHVSGVGVA